MRQTEEKQEPLYAVGNVKWFHCYKQLGRSYEAAGREVRSFGSRCLGTTRDTCNPYQRAGLESVLAVPLPANAHSGGQWVMAQVVGLCHPGG